MELFEALVVGRGLHLVIRGAPAVQLAVLLGEEPGVGVPAVLLGGGLHVQVPVHQQRLLSGVPESRDTEARVPHCARGYSRAQLPHEDRRQGQHGAVRERLGAEVHILDGGAQGLELVPCPPWQQCVSIWYQHYYDQSHN